MRRTPEDYTVHPTAVVDDGAIIGARTKIWHFTHIDGDVRIGEDCSFGQNCYVAGGVTVGNGCRVQNNVSIYRGVELADGVFCGPSMVFTNVRVPRARFPVTEEAYAPTYVGRDVSIGANATIVCGHRIGEGALIAAGAVVTGEVKPFTVMRGVPARAVGYVCRCGQQLHDEDRSARAMSEAADDCRDASPDYTCPACGRTYRERPDGGLEAREPEDAAWEPEP